MMAFSGAAGFAAGVENGQVDESRLFWFPHETEVWLLGEVQEHHDEGTLTIVSDEGTFEIDSSKLHPYNSSHSEYVEDIAGMNNLHEAPLLDLLRRRFHAEDIYTFTGDILISINPYTWIKGLYDVAEIPREVIDNHVAIRSKPHVYTVGERTYCQMMSNRKDQSLIVSGESGAGKTEACKRVMSYLASISKSALDKVHARTASHDLKRSSVLRIEERVLATNPFLEAFGNAKTTRNDNSSRFGKFLKIEYNKGKIVGASMRHYLLEKSRLVTQSEGERNYHIFYQLCKGASDEERARYQLENVEDYIYLTQSGCCEVEGVDDAKDFKEVKTALLSVGVEEEEQDIIFRTLSAILLLGNVAYGEDEKENAVFEDVKAVEKIADLIGCPMLSVRLLQREIRAGVSSKSKRRSSVPIVKLNVTQAVDARNALAKSMYDKIFSYLVSRINDSLKSTVRAETYIGILDIFGFEIFEKNSFEQLCINYTNEKLQSIFNNHVFVMEEEFYRNEGVDFSMVSFRDNKKCVALIEKKPVGILPLLDQVCMLGRGTDEQVLGQLKRHHKKHPNFLRPRFSSDEEFIIEHFAGKVRYNVVGFLEKNRDALHNDLAEMMSSSEQKLLSKIFSTGDGGSAAAVSSRGTKMPTTIAYKFKEQLNKLNKQLLQTEPHYIRCVKPNEEKRAGIFTSQMVLNQLLYSGVLETVRIRRQGYPFRETFKAFWEFCVQEMYDKHVNVGHLRLCKDKCAGLLTVALPRESRGGGGENGESPKWQIGRSKVFLRDGGLQELKDWQRGIVSLRIQNWWRGLVMRLRFLRLVRGVRALQRSYRAYMVKKRYEKQKGDVITIQRYTRGLLARRRFQRRKEEIEAALRIQTVRRAAIARRVYKEKLRAEQERIETEQRLERERQEKEARERAAAISIQTQFRSHEKRRDFMLKKRSATILQSLARYITANRIADERMGACVSLQCFVRMVLEKAHLQRVLFGIRSLQALYRGRVKRQELHRQRDAANLIKRGLRSATLNALLNEWVIDVHAQACLGELDVMVDILECTEDQYHRLTEMSDKANIRHPDSGYSLLHSAAKCETGDVEVLITLGNYGAELDTKKGWIAVDLHGNTPLHISCGTGDSHLEISKYIFSICTGPKKLILYQNADEATALDCALDAAMANEDLSGMVKFTNTINWLLKNGARSRFWGTKAEILAVLKDGKEAMKRLKAEKDRRAKERQQEKLKEIEKDAHMRFMMHGFNVENEGEKMKRFRFEEAKRQKEEQEERERQQKFLEAEILLEEERKRQERLKQERIEEMRRIRRSTASALDAAAVAVSPSANGADGEEGSDHAGAAAAVKAAAEWSKGVCHDGHNQEEEGRSETKGHHLSSFLTAERDVNDRERDQEQQRSTSGSLGAVAEEAVSEAEGCRGMLWVAQYASYLATKGDSRGWFYLDEESNVQGPFSSEDMASWSSQNYLDSDLLIRWGTGETYARLGSLFPDNSTAFSSSEVEKCLNSARAALKRLINRNYSASLG